MKPILLFGGAFDPIHDGHLLMALTAKEIFDCKKVIFIPSKTPVKEIQASGKDRKKMISLYLEENHLSQDEFEVSDYEIRQKEEYAYTIDTVRHFKEKYPKRKLYFLFGSDKLESLPKWKDIDKIAQFVQLVCYPRDTEINSDVLTQFHVLLLEAPLYPLSSKEIREGLSCKTGHKVMNYIADNQLYFCATIASMMKEHRYRHSVSVAKTAYKIALKNDYDPDICFLAGLYHDCGKDIPIEEQKRIVHEYYSQYEPLPDFALHQFAGAYLAKNKFGIQDEDILSAIAFHCTGNGEMSTIQKIIYAADKVEPTRQFETKIGRKACYKNIDSGFVTTLEEQKKYFLERNMTFKDHFLSKEMYEKYIGE